MSFIWQDMLWLLLAVPLLVWVYILIIRRRKRAVVRYANLALVKAALGSGPGWRRHIPPALLLLAIAVLIVAVARPATVIEIAASRSTVVLAMDVSGSMQARDIAPNRLVASQLAAKKFISEQPASVEIGIVAFASVAVLVQAPTIERESLYAAVDRLELRRGTAVGSGILTSLRTIIPGVNFYQGLAFNDSDTLVEGLRPNAPDGAAAEDPAAPASPPRINGVDHTPVAPGSFESAVIILLSDGETTAGPNPIPAGQIAADFGVRVYTVGFGTPEGAVVEFGDRSMRAEMDTPTLLEIARRTGGEYFEAQSADDLNRVYARLSTKLVGEKKLTEIAFIFAGIGAVLAAMAGLLSLWWFGRLA